MSEYIGGTSGILTTYGIEKLNEIIAETNNFTFSKIFISDKTHPLNENSTINDITYNYIFPIDNIKNDIGNKVISFTALIPPEITNYDIRTIGIICTENNENNLFAYSSVALNKPSKTELFYTLEISINYSVGIIPFNYNNFHFNTSKVNYANITTYFSVLGSYNTTVISLEKNHLSNAKITGYNKAQEEYKNELNLYSITNNFQNINNYSNINTIINQSGLETNIIDAFYNDQSTIYSSYKLLDLADFTYLIQNKNNIKYTNNSYNIETKSTYFADYNNSSYIDINNDLMKSTKNNISCINKTLLIQLTLDESGTSTDGIILQKINKENNDKNIFIIKKIANQINIKVFFDSGYIEGTTQLTQLEFKNLTSGLHNIVITCDASNRINEMLTLYIDGIKIAIDTYSTGTYNSDYTGDFILTNYDIIERKYTNNGNYINKILCFDRILSDDEISAISLSLK